MLTFHLQALVSWLIFEKRSCHLNSKTAINKKIDENPQLRYFDDAETVKNPLAFLPEILVPSLFYFNERSTLFLIARLLFALEIAP